MSGKADSCPLGGIGGGGKNWGQKGGERRAKRGGGGDKWIETGEGRGKGRERGEEGGRGQTERGGIFGEGNPTLPPPQLRGSGVRDVTKRRGLPPK